MNELQVVERSPKNEVAFGQQAATALMDIVRQKKLARKFGGEKEHLYVEAWEAVGAFAGLSAYPTDAEPIEIDGVKGAKSSATLIRDSDGMVLGGAVAYCMRDEPNWKNKPWFQLASMAQTRAVSKAFRIKLGWVASMAGYSGTPAEEMEGVHPEPTHTKPLPKKNTPLKSPLSKPQEESKESWDSQTEDLAEIRFLIKETGSSLERLLEWAKVDSLEGLSKEQVGKVLTKLYDRRDALAAKQDEGGE